MSLSKVMEALEALSKLPRYDYGYNSDEWGMSRSMTSYLAPGGKFVKHSDLQHAIAILREHMGEQGQPEHSHLSRAVPSEPSTARGYMGSTPDGGIDDHDEPNLPESLTREVDLWFAANTGLGGCSDKDVAELAEIFYGACHEGGRESVEDALSVVEGFGQGVAGLNDTYARQILLAQEVTRLRSLYEKAVQGRSDMRRALMTARDHIEMSALRVSHAKDAADIERNVCDPAAGGERPNENAPRPAPQGDSHV